MTITTYEGRTLEGYLYTYKKPAAERLPSARYKNVVLSGARKAGLASEAIREIEQIEVYKPTGETLERRNRLPDPASLPLMSVAELWALRGAADESTLSPLAAPRIKIATVPVVPARGSMTGSARQTDTRNASDGGGRSALALQAASPADAARASAEGIAARRAARRAARSAAESAASAAPRATDQLAAIGAPGGGNQTESKSERGSSPPPGLQPAESPATSNVSYVSILGYVMAVPMATGRVWSGHRGRDISGRLLRHVRGLSTTGPGNDDLGRPPFPSERAMGASELNFITHWLDHYFVGKCNAEPASVVAYLTEFRRQREEDFEWPPWPHRGALLPDPDSFMPYQFNWW